MTGMEHAIEQAAKTLWRCDNPDLHPAWVDRSWGDAGESGERAEYELRARALAEDGLLAPAPLREEWAAIDDDGNVRMRYGADSHSPHREFGTSWTYSRWASEWKPYDAAGDGRADQ